MSRGNEYKRMRAARDLAAHLGHTRAVEQVVDSAEPIEEDDRTKWRRRLQQKRCIACGVRKLHYSGSYFCSVHVRTHRYCSTCETLRQIEPGRKEYRCRRCASSRALARYHAYPDKNLYRLRLKELSRRTYTRGDQIFAGIRRRIALADFVKRTPGLTWRERGELANVDPKQLESSYWRQLRDDLQDVDATDTARNKVLRPR